MSYDKKVIIINPHCCTKEEYQELINYLEKNCWNYKIKGLQQQIIRKLQQDYAEAVEACKVAYRALSLDSDMEEDFAPEIKQLQKVINKGA